MQQIGIISTYGAEKIPQKRCGKCVIKNRDYDDNNNDIDLTAINIWKLSS